MSCLYPRDLLLCSAHNLPANNILGLHSSSINFMCNEEIYDFVNCLLYGKHLIHFHWMCEWIWNEIRSKFDCQTSLDGVPMRTGMSSLLFICVYVKMLEASARAWGNVYFPPLALTVQFIPKYKPRSLWYSAWLIAHRNINYKLLTYTVWEEFFKTIMESWENRVSQEGCTLSTLIPQEIPN